MSRAHARRKSGRTFDHAHPGQARSAPRKRSRQLQKRMAAGNYGQDRQNRVQCVIIIRGLDNWRDAFQGETTSIHPAYVKYHGGTTVTRLDYLRVNADLNRVSFERQAIGELLTRGYTLEGLEVEFDHRDASKWGVGTWYKEHPHYQEPVGWPFKPSAQVWSNFVHAMFKTEHAGDQKYGLFSTQMLGDAVAGTGPRILLHKTLIYRKVILAPPANKPAADKMAKAA